MAKRKMILYPIIGQIYDEMRRQDLDQKDIAEAMGTAESHISRILNMRMDPQLSTVIKIANALDMDIVIRGQGSRVEPEKEGVNDSTGNL